MPLLMRAERVEGCCLLEQGVGLIDKKIRGKKYATASNGYKTTLANTTTNQKHTGATGEGRERTGNRRGLQGGCNCNVIVSDAIKLRRSKKIE